MSIERVEIGLATLYRGDALAVLAGIPDESVDAVVADPPYMLGQASARRSADKPMGWADINNASHWYAAWMREAWRVARPAAPLWVFANMRSFPVLQCAASLIGGMNVTSVLVWDREWLGVGSQRGLRSTYELVVLFAKPEFAIADRALPDIWRYKWAAQRPSGHPQEKPVALILRLLEVSGIGAGAVVLDPFVGSGTTGVATEAIGARLIAAELHPPHVATAEGRIGAAHRQGGHGRDAQRQGALFGAAS